MTKSIEWVKALVERARVRNSGVDVAVRTLKRFSADDGGTYAAALTYYLFFSIFPLLLFVGSILGYLTFADAELRRELINQGIGAIPLLRDILTPEGLDIVAERRGTLAVTGVVLALYSGTGGVLALEHSLNSFHGIIEEPSWLAKRVRSLRFLAVLGSAGLVSLALSALGNLAATIFAGGTVLAAILSFIGGFVVSMGIFATAFRWLPAVNLSWADVIPGALVGAVAFEALKLFGTYYLARGDAARDDTFGTFAAAAALLVAAYLISQITLLAAEVNLAIKDRKNKRESQLGN